MSCAVYGDFRSTFKILQCHQYFIKCFYTVWSSIVFLLLYDLVEESGAGARGPKSYKISHPWIKCFWFLHIWSLAYYDPHFNSEFRLAAALKRHAACWSEESSSVLFSSVTTSSLCVKSIFRLVVQRWYPPSGSQGRALWGSSDKGTGWLMWHCIWLGSPVTPSFCLRTSTCTREEHI